jgi:hypothetical protein
MEQVLWCLSKNCRGPLLEGRSSPVLEALVWKLKSWWGIQGVPAEAKTLMARALAESRWSADLFEEPAAVADDAAKYAFDRVSTLVDRCMALGLRRHEFSLASKVLHWLLPWRIPAYDAFVRKSLGIPESDDLAGVYRVVTKELLAATREAATEDCEWLGPLEPRSPLRGFDKCLWWTGGGGASRAAEVKNPRHVFSELGLDPGADCD